MSQISPKRSPVSSSPVKPRSFQRLILWLHALWKFSRPHTIIGTSCSISGIYLLVLALHAGQEAGNSSIATYVLVPLLAWITCLCGNVYIVGLNQIEDVEIDKVNKPHLPLASGEFSPQEGIAIVATTGILALLLPLLQGAYLVAMVWLSVLIGTAYSLPPIRLKRFPFWASLCIFSVRGAIVNLGLFLHFSQMINGQAYLPPGIWALTLFIVVFTFAIAIFKDIPDMEGDRRYNITTFTIRLGHRAVFNLARWVITACYVGMMVAGIFLSNANPIFLIGAHGLALVLFWWLSFRVDLRDKRAIARFYQFIWKLFFLEYLVFPLAYLLH